MNYFELFGLKEAPTADKAVLALKYFELQKKFHPDFYTKENEGEQENATMQSAEINRAFNIFRDPEKTIEYFLQLKGVITPGEKYDLPPEFLMEMMEINESFDEAGEEGPGSRVTAYEKELFTGVGSLLQAENAAMLTAAELQELKSYYYKKKYLKRILERLDD